MMHEIVRARMALAAVEGMPEQTFYHLKRHAIQHSLYGVDLDPGAVEIAKLRLWLSMVVDEDNITDIQPLPNLDYKIMQGNSLLEEFDGVRLLDDKLLQPPVAREAEIAEIKARIAAKSQELFQLDAGTKISATRTMQRLAVTQQVNHLKKQLSALVNPDEAKTDGQGELNQQTSWASLKRIQELHEKFFDEDSRTEKDKLRRELDALEWDFMEATLREQGREEAIAELKRASAAHRKPFFLWRLHFAEVFQQRGGFDVVIANPPYVRQEEIKEFKPAFKRTFECFTGTADLFVYFYERGVKLLRPGGAIALITSNKYYRAAYGEKLRGFLPRELTLHQLIDFGDAPVFEAIAYASILTGVRTAPAPDASALGYTWEKDVAFDRIAQIVAERSQQIRQSELKPDGWRLELPAVLRLLEKLHCAGKPLDDYVNGQFFRGLVTGLNEAFVVDSVTCDRLIREHKSSAEVLKPFLRGRDVKRWRIEAQDLWLIFVPWHFPLHNDSTITGASLKAEAEFRKNYPAIYKHLSQFKGELSARNATETGVRYEWYALQRWGSEYWKCFNETMIAWGNLATAPQFTFVKGGHFISAPATFLVSDSKYLLGILNSQVTKYLVSQSAAERQGGFLEYKPMYVSPLAIPNLPPEKQKPVERLVERILSAKQRDAEADVSALERELDELVYALYGLTPEEIKLVEGSSK